jgi:hypothetical protein
MGEIKMSDDCSEGFRIYRAPNGKLYVRRYGHVVRLPSGGLRYFETEREAWAFLDEHHWTEMGRLAA